MLIGTQLYGFKKELTEDMEGALRQIRAIGFDIAEPIMVFREEQGDAPKADWALDTLVEAQKIGKEIGLQIRSAHVRANVGDDPKEVVSWLRRLHDEGGLDYFVFNAMTGDEEKSSAYGAFLKTVLQEAEESGFTKEATLLCHNHGMEFTRIGENRFAIDAILDAAGPGLNMELDFGWADYAGVSLDELRRFYDRVRLVHLKDFNLGSRDISTFERREEIFAAIGEGTCPIRETLLRLKDMKNWSGILILDQDYATFGMMKAMDIGLRNVERMLQEENIER